MKTVGIVGGIGPESTIEYYRSIVASYREQKRDGSYPSILINSIDLTRMLGLIGENRLAEVTVQADKRDQVNAIPCVVRSSSSSWKRSKL